MEGQPVKNLKWYSLLNWTISFQVFERLSSINFTWSIIEYSDSYNGLAKQIMPSFIKKDFLISLVMSVESETIWWLKPFQYSCIKCTLRLYLQWINFSADYNLGFFMYIGVIISHLRNLICAKCLYNFYFQKFLFSRLKFMI